MEQFLKVSLFSVFYSKGEVCSVDYDIAVCFEISYIFVPLAENNF